MNVRKTALVLLGLCILPAGAAAGPIEFEYSTGNITTSPWAPELAMTLRPYQPPGPVNTFDPTADQPVNLPAVTPMPSLIPTPAPRDLHPDGMGGGYAHWNNDGYFGVDVTLTDLASGESATFQFGGRAHMYNAYDTTGGWTGTTYFWFHNYHEVTLGGNLYTVWSDQLYTAGPATVNVWVGPNPPVHFTPEPGTFALAALGLAPFGLRRLRRS